MREKAAGTVRRILAAALLANGPGRARKDAAYESGVAVAKNFGSGGRVVIGRTIDALLAGETTIDSAVDTIVSAWIRRTAAAA